MTMAGLTRPVRQFFSRLPWCAPRSAPSGRNSLVYRYDATTDLLMARFGSPVDADSVEIEPGITVRLHRGTNDPVGIEIVDCASRFGRPPSAINAAYARELLARYGVEARRLLLERSQPRRTAVAY